MTSLSLFPRALALSAYSAVSGSRMTLCLAISCSALFACTSDPARPRAPPPPPAGRRPC